LDTIATRKQEDYILQSLVDPGATIAEGFQGKVSPMPPMGALLKPQDCLLDKPEKTFTFSQ
jgi:hypothetical protein